MSTISSQVPIPTEEDNLISTEIEVDVSAEVKEIQTAEGDKIITCTATKASLFYVDQKGYIKMLNSCGECSECGHMFHDSYLHSNEGMDEAIWPVFYVGRYCKDCWENS